MVTKKEQKGAIIRLMKLGLKHLGEEKIINGKRHKLIQVKNMNSRKYVIFGPHFCWHIWIETRQDWSKTPSFYESIADWVQENEGRLE